MSNEHDNFDFDDKTIIKVVGVGGGGINALNCMFNAGLKGVEYIVVDTDKKALSQSLASVHIPLISKAGDGRGNSLSTNAIPNIGGKVAEEYRKEIREALKVRIWYL